MLLCIPQVLGPEELQVARHILAAASFVDGRLSAGQAAAPVKHNQEADRQGGMVRQLDNLVKIGGGNIWPQIDNPKSLPA